MPRYEIKGSPISVAYGKDHATGIFLSVYDNRLEYDENASQEVNDVTKKIGFGDGGGSYFDLHTGRSGPGIKVSEETMLVYLKRFGVTDEQVQAMLNANKKPAPEHKCHVCETLTSKSCKKCMTVYYCSVKCQTGDWELHKVFCGLLPLPPVPKDMQKRVRGIFFPENSAMPQIVFVSFERLPFRDSFGYFGLNQQWINTRYPYSVMMRENPYQGGAFLENSLEFTFVGRDMDPGIFKPNQGVLKLTKGDHAFDWSGPILVCKRKGLYDDDHYDIPFIDIEMSDLSIMRDFFKAYKRFPI